MSNSILPFSFVIIPDTQDVCTAHPEKLKKMTQWIVDQKEQWNIKQIIHVGDLVNNGAERIEQWENHQDAFSVIEAANIPYIIAIGNHDYDNILNQNRDSMMFNRYTNKYKDKPWFGGYFEPDKAENMYTLLDVDGMKFIILSFEFGPRDEVLDWANGVLSEHQDRFAIIVTHSFLYLNAERVKPENRHNPKNYRGAHGANDGEDIWNKCIRNHRNIIAVFSGHHIADHVSYRFDRGEKGNIIFQSFQNWQCAPNGGDARIRLLHFDLDHERIDFMTFNPQTETFEDEDGYRLSIAFNLSEGMKEINLDKSFANILDPEVEKNKW